MPLTRLTFCLGLLILLTGVAATARQDASAFPQNARYVGIPKGGAGILESENAIIVYDQGRGRGKIIEKNSFDGENRRVLQEFVIK